MAMGEQLLHLLEELSEKEFDKFKFYLRDVGTASCIPRGRLDGASRVQVAELMIKWYPEEALDIMGKVLYKIPRRDLIRPGQLQTGEAGNSGNHANDREAAAAGAREPQAQGRQRLVSEQQLMKLAGKMGRDWKQIGIEFLGLERHCLEQIEENDPRNAKLQAFYMLMEWRKRAREGATASYLYSILSQDEVPLQPEALECLQDTGSA